MDKTEAKGVFPVAAEGVDASRNKVMDVVFIHGLGGDAYTTWQADGDETKFWPVWLSEDISNIGVWTVGYGASPTRWVEDEMPMQDRAFNLLHYFLANKIGEKPFILITHSMGGLIAKYLLTSAEQENTSQYRKIADNCTDIIFLAVPHNGSEVANIFEYARLFVRRNEIVQQLQQDESALRLLSNTFKNYVQRKKPRCISYYETKQLRIRKQGLLGLGRLVPFGKMIVSESSAIGNFSQELPIPLDEDHISICKINSRDDLLYLSMREIIKHRIVANKLDSIKDDDFEKIISERISFLDDKYENITRRMQDISQERNLLKSDCISEYRDVADWLGEYREILADRVSKKALSKYSGQINRKKIPETEEEQEDFCLDVSQFIGQLEVCLLQNSKKIMDEPYFKIEFDSELYELALSFLIERTPEDISPRSKDKLKYFIDYLITRI